MNAKKRPRSADTDDESDEEEDRNVVKTVGSEIFFYSEVTSEKVFELIEQVKNLESSLLKQAVDLPGYAPEITIYIQSGGGDVYAGFSGMDHLKQSRVKIYTVADGCCASAASFLLLGGTYRYVNPHTQVLVHQISSSGFWGKFEELKDEMAMCEKLMELVKRIYKRETDIPDKMFKTLMKRDVYLSPEECLEFRIVDEIAYPCSA